MAWRVLICILAGLVPLSVAATCDEDGFRVGAGIHDITGPVAEARMLGYAMPFQVTGGLRNRLHSRAFVIEDACADRAIAIAVADLCMVTQAVSEAVLERLAARFGDRFTRQNVLLSATHTHSGPGGYSHYALYNSSVFGFSESAFETAVDGIVESIARAQSNIEPAVIRIAESEVADAGINRSLEAYRRNPADERARYDSPTDRTMTLLRFDGADRALGVLNWFAVHATSMGNRNLLVNGDNKGFAAHAFEERMAASEDGAAPFVAAFAQGSEGDVSPNIHGGADGGGADDFESTEISGAKQLRAALQLFAEAKDVVSGTIDYKHVFVAMDRVRIASAADRATCPAAIGLSMLAGAEDGRGVGREGLSCAEPDSLLGRLACWVTTDDCQAEKPVAVTMGSKWPRPWSPSVLPLQLLRIGQLVVAALPFEVTTMSGRRFAHRVAAALRPVGVEHVVVASLSNAYSGYVATREEYAVQHYEGASTHFGPWTQLALEQELGRLAAAMREGETLPEGPQPPDLSMWQFPAPARPLFDATSFGVGFGDVESDVAPAYRPGDVVEAVFWGAHPGSDSLIEGSFVEIEKRAGDGWQVIADDADWETEMTWQRDYCLPAFACSLIRVRWYTDENVAAGTYRLRHRGMHRTKWLQRLLPYEGVSSTFEVDSAPIDGL